MDAKLIKIDRNGSKHYEGYVPCDRCGGTGTWVTSVTYPNGNERSFNTHEGKPY